MVSQSIHGKLQGEQELRKKAEQQLSKEQQANQLSQKHMNDQVNKLQEECRQASQKLDRAMGEVKFEQSESASLKARLMTTEA